MNGSSIDSAIRRMVRTMNDLETRLLKMAAEFQGQAFADGEIKTTEKPATAAATSPSPSPSLGARHGLRTRWEDGKEVLDGDHVCTAWLTYGGLDAPDEATSITWSDGLLVTTVVSLMDIAAANTLDRSRVTYGWRVDASGAASEDSK